MKQGEIMGSLNREEFSQEGIVGLAFARTGAEPCKREEKSDERQ
jgi:hypothetical protein